MATANYTFRENTSIGALVVTATSNCVPAAERSRAFGQLVARFQDMAFGAAYAQLGDTHLAEDAAQEAFLTAWRSLDNLREPDAFPGWFQQIVRSQCHRLTRGKKLPTVALEKVGDAPADGRTDPSRLIERNERDALVHTSLAALPEHEREATTLYYLGDYDQNEIAAYLGVPVTTIKKRIFSARKRLRERMTPYMEPIMEPTEPTKMVRETLSAARPSNDPKFTRAVAFWTAIEDGITETVAALLAEDAALATLTATDQETPLYRAARYGHVEIVGALLVQGAQPTVQRADGATPLHGVADGSTRIEIAERLLSSGADVNTTDSLGRTAVQVAALRAAPLVEDVGDGFALADFLLSRGATLDLWTAAALDRAEDICRMTKEDAEAVKKTNSDGETPLHVAARAGYRRATKTLLDAGADVHSRNKAGLTPLQVAKQPGRTRFLPPHAPIVAILLERGAKDEAAPPFTPLSKELPEPHHVASTGNGEKLRALLATDPDTIRRRDDRRQTPLHCAAANGHQDLVRLLLDAGALPNVIAEDGATPLHRAASAGHRAVVELLVERGADPKRTNFRGETPLFAACATDDAELVTRLLNGGSPVNICSAGRTTPLHAAVERGHTAVVRVLLAHGAETATQNYWGGTALHIAVRQGYTDIISQLLKAGADKLARDNWYRTPLHLAAWAGQRQAAEQLLNAGVAITELSYGFSTPLHVASEAGHIPVAELLLTRGAEVNAQSDFGRTPLHGAVQNGHNDMVRFLLAHGANPNSANDRGATPLHWAAASGKQEIIELLKSSGADATLKNQKGETPNEVAIRHGHGLMSSA